MEFTPRWIAWEITRRCNLRCIHCRSSSEQEVKDHTDFSTKRHSESWMIFPVMRNLSSYFQVANLFSGKMPLISQDMVRIKASGCVLLQMALSSLMISARG